MGFILYGTIKLLFVTYTLLLFVRVIGSWFPAIARSQFMRFVVYYTDPYLNLFRRILPPIGGTIDLSPILAFFALNLLEKFLLFLIR